MKRKLKLSVKIALLVILAIITFSIFLLEMNFSKNITKSKKLTYTKESNLNYVTYLKNNSHYDARYLKDDFNFVASLIDYFSLDYNYSYTTNEKVKYELTYEINAELEVYDSENDDKPIEKRPFELLKRTTLNGNSQIIKVDIFNQKIIYETYNKIVQEWKKEISPNANLKIYIDVKWEGYSKKLGKNISDKEKVTFIIPVSQKTISINPPTFESDTNNESGILTTRSGLPWWYIIIILLTLFIFLISVINLFMNIFSGKSKSKYEQKVNKILREFDRAITEAKGTFTMTDDENYIEVKSFMELLDVHDNVNEPIIYYKNSEDLSVFVIKNIHDIYYTIIRRSDFDD